MRRAITLAALASLVTAHASAQGRPRGAAQASPSAELAPPRAIRVGEVVLPASATESAQPLAVLMELDLDEWGRVSAARLVTSSGVPSVDERVLAAARDFEFDPARRGGRAIAVTIRYRYVCAAASRRAADEDAPRPTPQINAARPSAAPSQRSRAASSPVRPSAEGDQGVTVFGRVASREIFRREVSADEVRRIAGARGDALLAVQNLPGVARSQFGLGQFVVRSSPPEDSLVLLEGHPIALPFHLYGLASAIATDLIERIEVVPGNFSARFGRVAGGVVNVTLRAPPRDRVRASVDVDVIDAGAFASVPIGRRASVAIGARGSYLSLLAPLFIPADGASFRQWPRYWDWQVSLDWDPTERDSIRVVGSGTDDAFVSDLREPDPNDPMVRGEVSTRTTFHGAQARWRHRLGPSATHTFSIAGAYQLQDVRLGPAVRYRFEALNLSLRDELDLRVSAAARVLLGVDVQGLLSDDQVRAPPVATSGLSDPISPATLVTYRAVRAAVNPAVYGELELAPSPTVKLLAGVRADYLSYARRATIDPRASLRWALSRRVAVRAGLGGYSSAPRGYATLPGFGNTALAPERWVHAGVGVEWEALAGALDLDLGLFAKGGASVIVASDRIVEREGARVSERFSNDGVGRVVGAEVSARMRPGRLPLFVLVSYTLQSAERAACAGCAWVTYTWDQPHNLSASLGALLPRGFELGARLRVSSGLVEPVVTGAIYDAATDTSLTLVDPSRVGRLPPFVSLDVRGAWKFRAGPIRGQLVLEVLNATNYENVESRLYSFDRRASQPVLGLPVLPSIGLAASY
ncbi:MAG: TonB-dependent receptor [Myxococcales bacterium]|nr:TonB-dependent receptor [Myxococcales bacterium]